MHYLTYYQKVYLFLERIKPTIPEMDFNVQSQFTGAAEEWEISAMFERRRFRVGVALPQLLPHMGCCDALVIDVDEENLLGV